MARKPLSRTKLVWKHPPKRKTPKASEPPAINAPGRKSFLPPDAPRKRVQSCGQDSCSSPQEQQRSRVAIPYDEEENRELGLLDRDLERLVLERIPLASRMTARAVSRAWNSKLSTRPPATLVVLNAWNSRQLIAFDTCHGFWAALPDACSLPVGASRLLGAAGDVALAKSECPGRVLVGSPLGGGWADVVLPPMWLSDMAVAPVHFLTRRPHDAFQVISIHGHTSYVSLYDSSRPGHWSTRKPAPCIPRFQAAKIPCHDRAYHTIAGDTIYYEDQIDRATLSQFLSRIVRYSLLDQSTAWTVSRWPDNCTGSGGGKMVYCGGHLFVIDVGTRSVELQALDTIVVWRFVWKSGEWLVESNCPVGARRTSSKGYCFDGVDVLWVVMADEEGSVENLHWRSQRKKDKQKNAVYHNRVFTNPWREHWRSQIKQRKRKKKNYARSLTNLIRKEHIAEIFIC
ncbi:hypothetical protein SELMODRAFT_413805 [Selaginella moellendorffii]|uniref:F-box domain-containing protein n=1 Tax=Selaginella moellendorffii TaxID=88036 RepID=D8RQ97_SELML|nr:hypothetical protein SELMODRAFT_413805 [Selaginella moellendorffii]